MSRAEALTDIVRFPSTVSSQDAGPRPTPIKVVADHGKASFEATLAFVEKAAETIQSLRRELDASESQALGFANQLQLERRERQAEAARLEDKVESWREAAGRAEKQAAEAKLVATTAIQRCEDIVAREMRAIQRARAAEARADAAEGWLAKLKEAMEAEFSSLFARDHQ